MVRAGWARTRPHLKSNLAGDYGASRSKSLEPSFGVPGVALWVANVEDSDQKLALAARAVGVAIKGSVLTGFYPYWRPTEQSLKLKKRTNSKKKL